MTELLIFGLECQVMENVKDLENMSVIASFHSLAFVTGRATYRREYSKVHFFEAIAVSPRREKRQQLRSRYTSIARKWNLQIIIICDIRIRARQALRSGALRNNRFPLRSQRDVPHMARGRCVQRANITQQRTPPRLEGRAQFGLGEAACSTGCT
jgi:hypothetical protein